MLGTWISAAISIILLAAGQSMLKYGLMRAGGVNFGGGEILQGLRTMLTSPYIVIDHSLADLYRLDERLAAYEKQYAMSSAEFYRRFRVGELGDDADMVEWSAFWEMRQATQKRLAELTKRQIAFATN